MFKYILLPFFITFIIVVTESKAQTDTTEEVSVWVGEPASFIGDYSKFLRKNLNYPEDARKKEIEGTVIIRFVVEKDGTLSDIKVTKAIYGSLNQEAIRVVHLTSGKWKPGTTDGKAVRSYKSLAINFFL